MKCLNVNGLVMITLSAGQRPSFCVCVNVDWLVLITFSGAPRPRHCGENDMSFTPNLLNIKILMDMRNIMFWSWILWFSDVQIIHWDIHVGFHVMALHGDDALMTVIKTNLMTTHVHVKYKDKYNDVPRTCNAEVQRCPETWSRLVGWNTWQLQWSTRWW